MPPLLNTDDQLVVTKAEIGNPSSAMLADRAEVFFLPSPKAPRQQPAPAENPPLGRESSTEVQPGGSGKLNATPVIRLRTSRVPHRRFEVLQQFEGIVLNISQDAFEAQLSDMTDPGKPEEFVDLPLNEISPADRPLLVQGCVFYWILGYETREGGQITRVSEIRLRRSPPWSRRAVEAARAKAGETFKLLKQDGKTTRPQA
jgi:hypothetical protein